MEKKQKTKKQVIIKVRSPENSEFVKRLDDFALKLQKDSKDEEAFNAIHVALHKYIIGQAFHRFIIRGHDGKDLYQEALIVLWQKAIPSFDPTRGMSFLGFAKMCINRHLITILNSALNRKKDMPMNRSVSLDEIFGDENEDTNCSLANILEDPNDFLKEICFSEDKEKTVEVLRDMLSPFESMVLYYYLEGMSYREMSRNISKVLERRCNEKSVDNALLRIRRKAVEILGEKILPLFDKDLPNKVNGKCNEKSVDNAITRIKKKASGIEKTSLPLFR
jgi:RNA polymerase sporulation-specific sigma factor